MITAVLRFGATVDYEIFSSDLRKEWRRSFKSFDENEEEFKRSGFDLAVRQTGNGEYRADLVTVNAGESVLFSQRINVALTIHARVPVDSVLFLFPRWVSGQYTSAGVELGSEALLLLPAGEVIDLVLPDLAGSDSILVSKKRYLEMAAALCPLNNLPETATVVEVNTTKLNQLRSVFRAVMNHPESKNAPEVSTSLLALLVSYLADSADCGQGDNLRDSAARMHCAITARDFIDENFHRKLYIEELCRATGVGVRTLQRCFRAYFGISISEYTKTVRLDSVYRALLAADPSTTTVTQIGQDLGCTHPGRLSVQFHQRFGKCPNQVLEESTALMSIP